MIKKVHILDLGSLEFDLSYFTWKINIGKMYRFPVYCTLVEHSEGDILIDTGYSLQNARKHYAWEKPMQSEDQSLESQLKLAGKRPEDIKHVILSHLHFDHAGNNDAFPGATFFVQRTQYDAAIDNPAFPNQYWRLEGLNYHLLDGETDLGDGISVIPTPGHAPGHQSVLVRLDSGENLILCGDAIYEDDNVKHDVWEGHADPTQARESALQLLGRAKELKAQVFYGHDAEQWKNVRKSPSWYE